jgi:hypothetical protein
VTVPNLLDISREVRKWVAPRLGKLGLVVRLVGTSGDLEVRDTAGSLYVRAGFDILGDAVSVVTMGPRPGEGRIIKRTATQCTFPILGGAIVSRSRSTIKRRGIKLPALPHANYCQACSRCHNPCYACGAGMPGPPERK